MNNYRYNLKAKLLPLGLIALAVGATACLPRQTSPGSLPPDASLTGGANQKDGSTGVAYATLRDTIFIPNDCFSCHKDMGSDAELLKYVKPGDPEGSVLFQKLSSGEMPMGGTPLGSGDLDLVRAYIVGLAPSVAPAPSASPSIEPSSEPTVVPTASPSAAPSAVPSVTPPANAVDYATLKSSLLDVKCARCHKGDISTEAKLQKWGVSIGQPENSPLYTYTLSGKMPRGGAHLSDAEMAMIRNYILNAQPVVAPAPSPTPSSTEADPYNF